MVVGTITRWVTQQQQLTTQRHNIVVRAFNLPENTQVPCDHHQGLQRKELESMNELPKGNERLPTV